MKKSVLIATMLTLSGVCFNPAIANDEYEAKTFTWRYKMTVTVDTPTGEKSGFSVNEVRVLFKPAGNSPSVSHNKYNTDIDLNGEAVALDLGELGTVFALLRGPLLYVNYGSRIPFYAFDGPPGLTLEGARYYSTLRAKSVLKPTHYPSFVTFIDMEDPKTVVPLLKMKSNNQYPTEYKITESLFAKYFGEGVELKSVELEMTSEPVTRKIEGLMPPYLEDTDYREWFKSLPYFDERKIGPSDFKQEFIYGSIK